MATAGVAALALFVAGCQQSAEVRYRITVSVKDQGHLRSGSSVWSFALEKGVMGSYDGRLRGEAVVVDLPGQGRLFALLAGRSAKGLPTSFDSLGMLPEYLFGDGAHGDRIADLRAIKRRIGEIKAINCTGLGKDASNCPFMVRFDDLHDPTSVHPVNPNNLAATFGNGVTLESVTVEITDDAVSTNNSSIMPHYVGKSNFNEWYENLTVHDPRRVGPENFWQGARP